MRQWLRKHFSQQERRLLLFCIVGLEIVSILPFVYGLLTQPEGAHFTFTQFTAVNDWFVYYSYILQAKTGSILFSNLFSPDAHSSFIHIFWLLVGWFAKVTFLSPELAFVVVRLLLIPVAVVFLYRFIGVFYQDLERKVIGLVLLLFSSGAGFLLVDRFAKFPGNYEYGVFNWPMDLWVPEANTFLTLYTSPHFIASLLLILTIFWGTLSFLQTKLYKHSVVAGLAALVLFAFHPFHILSVFMVLLCYGCVLWLRLKKFPSNYFWHGVIVFCFSVPAIGYYLHLLQTDLVTQLRAIQNVTYTTPFWITMFSFGVLGCLAFVGLWKARDKNISTSLDFLFIWLLVHALVIYFPVDYQRRMTAGLHVVIVLATLYILPQLLVWYKKQIGVWRSFVLSMTILFLFASVVFQIAAQVYIYYDNRGVAYVDTDIIAAAEFLSTLEGDLVVLNSANSLINIVPAYSGKHVYVGHGVETPFFAEREAEVRWFFSKNREMQRDINFLNQHNITHVFWGPTERSFGTYSPSDKQYLKLLYSNNDVAIYEVL